MDAAKKPRSHDKAGVIKAPVWRSVVQNVFGAAVRLHRYRDQRDALLGRVLLDYEQQLRDDRCCSE